MDLIHYKALAHVDDDDAGLRDDVLGEVFEGGVGVIIEALQVLHHVVQLDDGPQSLSVPAALHLRGQELQERVVFTEVLSRKLRDAEEIKSFKMEQCCSFHIKSKVCNAAATSSTLSSLLEAPH